MSGSSRTTYSILGGGAVLTAVALVIFSHQTSPDQSGNAAPETPAARPARATASRSGVRPDGRRQFADPTDGGWARIASDLKPAQAKEMLERDKLEEKNIEARSEHAWHIINQLCRNGYAREAWELIDASPGLVREKGLGGFFRDANLPEAELISMMGDLQNKDRASAYYNYWSRFSADQFARMDLSQFPMQNPVEFASFRNTMQDMLGESFDPKNPEAGKAARYDLLSLALKQANEGGMDYAEFKAFLEKDPSKDGFTYWEVMKSATPEIRESQTHGQANYTGPDAMVIRAMTMQDPEKTMAMTIVPDSHEANYVHIALGKWLENDFDNAQKWYNDHEATFTPDQLQRTAVAFVRAQVARGEYQSAAEWSAKLNTPRWIGAVASEQVTIAEHLQSQ